MRMTDKYNDKDRQYNEKDRQYNEKDRQYNEKDRQYNVKRKRIKGQTTIYKTYRSTHLCIDSSLCMYL
jgi:hypothetical protein